MPATLFALLLAAAPPAPPAPSAGPLLTTRSDGSWAVLEAIYEETPPLVETTRGLLADEREWDQAEQPDRHIAEEQAEAAAERAFEEAVDAARREPRR